MRTLPVIAWAPRLPLACPAPAPFSAPWRRPAAASPPPECETAGVASSSRIGDNKKADSADCAGLQAGDQAKPLPDLNKRERRALMALLARPLTREQLDATAGCSNSPDLVLRLRHALGMQIPCKKETVTDRDGRAVRRGRYSLAPTDKHIARAVLAAGSRGCI